MAIENGVDTEWLADEVDRLDGALKKALGWCGKYEKENERLAEELAQYRRILEKFQACYLDAVSYLCFTQDATWPVSFALLRVASMALDDNRMERIAREDGDGR